ncbi:MAG: hypothetical protein ABII24_02340 [bacterium]
MSSDFLFVRPLPVTSGGIFKGFSKQSIRLRHFGKPVDLKPEEWKEPIPHCQVEDLEPCGHVAELSINGTMLRFTCGCGIARFTTYNMSGIIRVASWLLSPILKASIQAMRGLTQENLNVADISSLPAQLFMFQQGETGPWLPAYKGLSAGYELCLIPPKDDVLFQQYGPWAIREILSHMRQAYSAFSQQTDIFRL